MQDYLAQLPGVVQQTTIRTARACANSALMGAGAHCYLLINAETGNRVSVRGKQDLVVEAQLLTVCHKNFWLSFFFVVSKGE